MDDRVFSTQQPRVTLFQGNIYYDEYYSDSAGYLYAEAFYRGYNMQDYAFAEECFDS